MDPFYKSYVETDLAFLHYLIFIEPLAVLPTEALSFDSELFTNNSVKKVVEGERNDPFVLLEEHLFAVVLLYKKIMKSNLKTYHMKFLSSSPNHKVSGKSFVHNNVYNNNFIVIIFILQSYKLIVEKMYSFYNIVWGYRLVPYIIVVLAVIHVIQIPN
jgi:hypothetical protein